MVGTFRGCLLVFVAVAALAACNDDGGGTTDASPPPDAAVPDARTDAVPAASVCERLCDCTVEECGDEMVACVAECQGLPASSRSCRFEHCTYARIEPVFHCPHALGDEICD